MFKGLLTSISVKLKKEWFIRVKHGSIDEWRNMDYRNQGMYIGENVHIYSNIHSKEPYMISIGDNTTISGDILLVTHDNSISKYLPEYTDTFGKITIGRNCFIGMRSMILAGVSLADNTIVAAGSVVTKSVEEPGYIIAGAPARVIGTVEEAKDKNKDFGFNIHGLTLEDKKTLLLDNEERLIKR